MKKFCVGVAAALLLPLSLLAQQDADSVYSTLDPAIITANKIVQKQSQTGKVVTVIDKQTMLQNQGKTIGQLLNESAGITLNGALNNLGTNQSVYTRGSSSGRTLILLDGIPVYDPSLIGNEFDLNFLANGLIERIEIARGAQSTLYGSDAIGGVINIITKAAASGQAPLSADAGLSYGSFNTLRGFGNMYGRSGRWSYQAGVHHTGSRGFSAAHDRLGAGNFDDDGFNQQSVQARIGYQLAPGFQWSAFSHYARYKADIDAGAFVDDRDFTNRTYNPQTGMVFDLKKKVWDARIQYAYGQVQRKLLNDSGHVSGFAKYMQDDYLGRSHFLEAYGSVALSPAIKLLAGLDYRRASMKNEFLSISSFGPFTSTFNDTSVYLASFYNSLLVEKNNFNLEAGFRVNQHETFGTYTTFTFNPSLKLNASWRLFGSVASGFKAPSLFQLYSFAGRPDLQPEKAFNYEGGVSLTRPSAQVRLTAFYRDIEKGLDFDYINFVYFNAGRQQVTGIETEGFFQLAQPLTFQFNYTWLAGQETVQSRLTTKDTSYNYLLKRPEHQLFAALAYTPADKWRLSVNALAVSQRKDVGGFQQPDVVLDGYIILGINASYKAHKKLVIFADVQNLLDKVFFDVHGFNSMRRNIQGGLRVSL